MIASVWLWPSLQYQYYLIPDRALDAGGWEAQRGLAAASTSSAGESVAFEAALESLPENAAVCGTGEECVGELFALNDDLARPEADLVSLKSSSNPDHQKVASLLEGSVSARGNEGGSPPSSVSADRGGRMLIWEKMLPILTGIGAGIAILKYTENLTIRSALLSWFAGAAVGITVGLEVAKSKYISGDE